MNPRSSKKSSSTAKAVKITIPDSLKDFRNFVWLVWKHLNLPDPTEVQYDIAKYMQSNTKRSIIEAFRGVGKSYLASAYVCHQLLLDPDKKFLVVSASKSRADDFSTFTLRLINEMDILHPLIPKDNDRYSKVAFDVGLAAASHSPSVKSLGITSMMTGSRADCIIADDVESLNNSLTQGNRDRISDTVKEFESILKPDGRIMFLGTPQCEMSLYNQLVERGYEIQIWPARYPDETRLSHYGSKLSTSIRETVQKDPSLVGKTTDPLRFTDIDLGEREASYGRSMFNLQFMLDTALSDQNKYPLKLSDLVVLPLDKEALPSKVVWSASPSFVIDTLPVVGLTGDRYYRPADIIGTWTAATGCVMAIDPSGRGKDETAYAVIKMLNSQLFLVASGGFSDGYTDTTLEGLARVAKHHKVNKVVVESNFGDGMFLQLLKPVFNRVYPVTCEEVRHSKQKEARIIDTIEPILNQHRLVVDTEVIKNDYQTSQDSAERGLMYQLTRLTRDKGSLACDDRLDALSIAVGYWVEQLSQSVDEAVKRQDEEALLAELEKFEHNTLGSKRLKTKSGLGLVYKSLS
jgi:hypothetical protein